MSHTVERKFIVTRDGWTQHVTSTEMILEGLDTFGGAKIRVMSNGTKAWLAFKGPRRGCTRCQFEYEIPAADADAIIKDFEPNAVTSKMRNYVLLDGKAWIIDIHKGAREGLVTAEIQLENEQQRIDLPDWIGREITAGEEFILPHLC